MIAYLDLTHLNEELVDMKCEVDIKVYHGSTQGCTSDDPSSIDILSVKLCNPSDCPAIGSNEITITEEMEEQIYDKYEQN